MWGSDERKITYQHHNPTASVVEVVAVVVKILFIPKPLYHIPSGQTTALEPELREVSQRR